MSELETELDELYGKLEALTHQHKTQQEKMSAMNHTLQDEVGDVAEELRHVQKELEARNKKVRSPQHIITSTPRDRVFTYIQACISSPGLCLSTYKGIASILSVCVSSAAADACVTDCLCCVWACL